MKEKFLSWKPTAKSRSLMINIDSVLEKYRKLGYTLTLRQLYYQLVARDIIANTINSYARLGNIMTRARLAGIVDWDMIEDRVRRPEKNAHWDSPEEIMNSAVDAYYKDRWVGQEYYIEVWSEKDAVSNIIQPICEKYDVTFLANRGYSSLTAMYDAHNRILSKEHYENKKPVIIYLGDHDPSGIDMTHDIENRIGTFLYHSEDVLWEDVSRIALNMDQIEEYKPPENPAKITDSRYKKYIERFGESCWELDALEPTVLAKLVESCILGYLDMDKFVIIAGEELKEKSKMREVVRENFGE